MNFKNLGVKKNSGAFLKMRNLTKSENLKNPEITKVLEIRRKVQELEERF